MTGPAAAPGVVARVGDARAGDGRPQHGRAGGPRVHDGGRAGAATAAWLADRRWAG